MSEPIDCVLLTNSLVHLLKSQAPDFDASFAAIQRSARPMLRYPDGSLEYEQHLETEGLWRACIPRKLLLPVKIADLGNFRSVPSLPASPPPRRYAVMSIEEHEKWIDPIGCVRFAPGLMQDDYPQSLDLSNLRVNLRFYRRVSRRGREILLKSIRDWHTFVSARGMFGEGPVRNVSTHVEFQGNRVQFSFDASETGQRTLNWLVLSILNASYGVVRLSAFVFNDVDNLAAYGLGPSDEKTVRLPLYDPSGHPSAPAPDSPPDSRLPAGLVPCPSLQSDFFTIWQAPSHEWESLLLTVYFEGTPTRDQQADFRRLLSSWLVVAQCGGFGGKGIPFFEDPIYLKKPEVGFVRADLGDVDVDLALTVLIRLLENYGSGTLGIEAIVFGLNPKTGLVI